MIDLLGHIRINVITLQTTEITFYGTMGYVMFVILCLFGIYGGFNLANKLRKLTDNQSNMKGDRNEKRNNMERKIN